MNAREERAAQREAEVKAIEAEYEAADRTPETCPDCDAILPRWAQAAPHMLATLKNVEHFLVASLSGEDFDPAEECLAEVRAAIAKGELGT
jgi:hypothetical protein